MAGELLYPDKLWAHLEGILEWKNLTLTGVYGAEPVTMDDLKAWMDNYCEKIKPFICDTGVYLRKAQGGREENPGLKPSWARCGIWTTVSIPTPPHPTPSPLTPPWFRSAHRQARRCGRRGKGLFLLAWAKAPLCANGSGRTPRSSGTLARSTAPRPGGPAG